MIEYRINSSALVSAPARLALAKEQFGKGDLVTAYELMYTMLPDVLDDAIRRVLTGEIETRVINEQTVVVFFNEEQVILWNKTSTNYR